LKKRPKNIRDGGDVQQKRDLTRFVRWPKYIILQRQKRILLQRLKVPPALNQFTKTLDKNQAVQVLKLLDKYRPETKQKKKERLVELAKQKAQEKPQTTDKKAPVVPAKKRPEVLKYGLKHVTHLVENKQARLVVIAHDVDPIELVIWLPQLCRKQEIPFCFIKNKARLGKLVYKKTATCVALTSVRKEDASELELLAKNFRVTYNENADLKKTWGGGLIGMKSQHEKEVHEKAVEKETLKKTGAI